MTKTAWNLIKRLLSRQPLRPTWEHLLINFMITASICIVIVFFIGYSLPPVIDTY